MPDDMIEQVHRIARHQKANTRLVFADRTQNRTEEENNSKGGEETDDNSYSNNKSSHDSEDEWEDHDYEDEEEIEHAQPIAGAGIEDEQVPAGITGVHKEVQDNEEAPLEDIAGMHEEEGEHNEEQEEILGVEEDVQDNDEAQQQLEDTMSAKYGPHSGHYNLRSRREHDYSHLFAINIKPSSNPGVHAKRCVDRENRKEATGAKSRPGRETPKVVEHGTGMCT